MSECIFFFFSSRRRHTRFDCDWSSDVCSSDLLLMDEWLSAGDVRFLDKAQKRMEEFVGRSRILVLASHSIELIRKWCNRGIMLQHGRIATHGEVNEVIADYIGAPAPELAAGQHREILSGDMTSREQH